MNEASNHLDLLVSDYNDGDWDSFASRISDELRLADHRGNEPVTFTGLSFFVGGVKQTVRDGFTRFDYEAIDTAEHVVLARITVRADDGRSDERLAVYRFGPDSKLAHYDSYRSDDLVGARGRFDELTHVS